MQPREGAALAPVPATASKGQLGVTTKRCVAVAGPEPPTRGVWLWKSETGRRRHTATGTGMRGGLQTHPALRGCFLPYKYAMLLTMKHRLAAFIALLACIPAQAWNTHWAAVFYGVVPGEPMVLALSREPCPVVEAKRDGWKDAQEAFPNPAHPANPYFKPACWKRLDELRIVYCIVAPVKKLLTLECKPMEASRFADAKSLFEEHEVRPAEL